MNLQHRIDTINQRRLISIDIIRGFAILGIFFVNILSFHSPLLYMDPLSWWDEGLDYYIYSFIDVFVQGSFYPLFAFLFGFSFVLLKESMERRHLDFNRLARRRMGFLFGMGMFHIAFIWYGDILVTYSVFGFLLIVFQKLNGTSLIKVGIYLFTIPAMVLVIMSLLASFSSSEHELMIENSEAIQQSYLSYQQGSFFEITKQRMMDWHEINHLGNFPFLLFMVFPLFLIGAGVAKGKWLEKPEFFKKELNAIILVSLAGGLLLKMSPYLFERSLFTESLKSLLGGTVLAIFYGSTLIRLFIIERVQHWLRPLAAVGRMSVTNYLLQSLISSLTFYHYGFGQYGKVSLLGSTWFVLGVFFIQVVLSHIWLKRYYYGPIEYFWRRATYGKIFGRVRKE